MKQNYPSNEVLIAFNIKSKPKLLKGGDRHTYKADNTVLKTIYNEDESNGIAELFSRLESKHFYTEKPIKSIFGKWVHKGWGAFTFVDGKESKSRWKEKIEISKKLHQAISKIKKPAYIDKVNHPWAIADRMVWGDTKLVYNQRLKNTLYPLQEKLKPINLKGQLIHGDISGNILFNEPLPPTIIDMSPNWRPANYATAIIIVDAIVWEKAPDSLLKEMNNNFESNQLLLRAVMWRIKATEEYIKHFKKGAIDKISAYNNLINLLIKRSNQSSSS